MSGMNHSAHSTLSPPSVKNHHSLSYTNNFHNNKDDYRLSHDVVTCYVDRDVSTAHC